MNRRSMYHYLYGDGCHEAQRLFVCRSITRSWGYYNDVPRPLDLILAGPRKISPNFLKRVYQKMGMNALRTNDAVLCRILGRRDLSFDQKNSYNEDLFSGFRKRRHSV